MIDRIIENCHPSLHPINYAKAYLKFCTADKECKKNLRLKIQTRTTHHEMLL